VCYASEVNKTLRLEAAMYGVMKLTSEFLARAALESGDYPVWLAGD
jgi:hypothetical protein